MDVVRTRTNCGDKTKFARWIGVKSPQVVRNWEARDSLSRDGATVISKVTGADLGFLLTGKGDPFPSGPILFDELNEMDDSMASQTRVALEDLRYVILGLARHALRTTPDAAESLRADLVEVAPIGYAKSQIYQLLFAMIEESKRHQEPDRQSARPPK